jgi:hypothetical protein
MKEGKFGFIDKSGNAALPFQYDDANDFGPDSLAAVKRGNFWGVIDRGGKMIFDPLYKNALGMSEGLAAVQFAPTFTDSTSLWGFIDSKSNIVVKGQFEQAALFSEGLSAVRKGNKWGYINHTGEFVIQPQFDFAEPFRGGYAKVMDGGKFGYVRKDGSFLRTPQR